MTQQKETIALRFIEDPGHGWLEVPVELLDRLDLIFDVSYYSYIAPQTEMVYLEEDVDVDKFLKAAKDDGIKPDIRNEYQEHTFVRKLPSYDAITVNRWLTDQIERGLMVISALVKKAFEDKRIQGEKHEQVIRDITAALDWIDTHADDMKESRELRKQGK